VVRSNVSGVDFEKHRQPLGRLLEGLPVVGIVTIEGDSHLRDILASFE
jgi:hypothetical protein